MKAASIATLAVLTAFLVVGTVDGIRAEAQDAAKCSNGFELIDAAPKVTWIEESTRWQAAQKVIIRDSRGDWQGYRLDDGTCYPGALVSYNAETQAVEDAMVAARAAQEAAAATKRDAAAGPAVRQKLRDVAAGTGTLTQPQMARLFLHLLNE